MRPLRVSERDGGSEIRGVPGSGNYALQMGSPATPAESACKELIGAVEEMCGDAPTDRVSWGEIKSRYR